MNAATKEPWEAQRIRSEGSRYFQINAGAQLVAAVPVEHWHSEAERAELARRIAACVNACAGIPTEQLESTPPEFAVMPTPRVVRAVFFHIIDGGDWRYLGYDDFSGEDPDQVRCDFGDAVETTLETLVMTSNAENCGAVGDIVLGVLPNLRAYFEETSEQ